MSTREPAGAAVLQPRVTDAITEAVLDEWTDNGYARISMEAVARRAKVGKSALYRRWPSKQDMAMAVLGQRSQTAFPAPDTGSLHGDLFAIMQAMHTWLTTPRIAPIVADLVAETTRDPDLGAAVETVLRTPHRAQVQAMFENASARGELGPTADPDIVLELIAAIIYWRAIVRPQPLDDTYLHAVINTIEHELRN